MWLRKRSSAIPGAVGSGAKWVGGKAWSGTKLAGRGIGGAGRAIGNRYDWEKEKEQARAIGRFGSREWGKEKQAMRDRAQKTKQAGEATRRLAERKLKKGQQAMRNQAEKLRNYREQKAQKKKTEQL